jgi:hypothetical protein
VDDGKIIIHQTLQDIESLIGEIINFCWVVETPKDGGLVWQTIATLARHRNSPSQELFKMNSSYLASLLSLTLVLTQLPVDRKPFFPREAELD